MGPQPSKNTPLISVVLSFRNEETVIPELISRLHKVLVSLPVEYELIFVNDASTDDSLPLLMEKARENRRIKIINMSRRFGVSECVLAGMKYTKGDAVIYMDADLQDPPEVIPELTENWQQGADVVYTVRTSREGESPLHMLITKLAYRSIRIASEVEVPVDAGDFKLLSRRVVDELLMLNEQDPYLRGLIPWLGFRQVPVSYQRQPRAAGETHFRVFGNLVRDAVTLRGPTGSFITGITSNSIGLLLIFLAMGLAITFAAAVALVAVMVLWLTGRSLSEFYPLIIAISFLSGIQLLGIGILGLYLGRTYHEVRNRPRYIVESTIGFEDGVLSQLGDDSNVR